MGDDCATRFPELTLPKGSAKFAKLLSNVGFLWSVIQNSPDHISTWEMIMQHDFLELPVSRQTSVDADACTGARSHELTVKFDWVTPKAIRLCYRETKEGAKGQNFGEVTNTMNSNQYGS